MQLAGADEQALDVPPAPPARGESPGGRDPGTTAASALAELVELAGTDKRARRKVLAQAAGQVAADADAARQRLASVAEAERRAAAVEAEAEARVRAAAARVRVQKQEQEARRAEREAKRLEKAYKREERAEWLAAWGRRLGQWRRAVGAFAPAALSTLVYLAAVGSAIFGQVSVATGRYGWPLWRALTLAGFIELMALSMALTANHLRLRGQRGLAAICTVLTWVFAVFAATVNVWGHSSDMLLAVGLGAASLGGIVLWEIRSAARHYEELRKVYERPEHEPLGLGFVVLYPRVALAVYRLRVRTQVSSATADLISQVETRVPRGVSRRGVLAAGSVGLLAGMGLAGWVRPYLVSAMEQASFGWELVGGMVLMFVVAVCGGAVVGRRLSRKPGQLQSSSRSGSGPQGSVARRSSTDRHPGAGARMDGIPSAGKPERVATPAVSLEADVALVKGQELSHPVVSAGTTETSTRDRTEEGAPVRSGGLTEHADEALEERDVVRVDKGIAPRSAGAVPSSPPADPRPAAGRIGGAGSTDRVLGRRPIPADRAAKANDGSTSRAAVPRQRPVGVGRPAAGGDVRQAVMRALNARVTPGDRRTNSDLAAWCIQELRIKGASQETVARYVRDWRKDAATASGSKDRALHAVSGGQHG